MQIAVPCFAGTSCFGRDNWFLTCRVGWRLLAYAKY